MPYPMQSPAPPMQDDAINAFTGREPGGGGLSMAGVPPGAMMGDEVDPADVEFDDPQQMGLSNLSDLHRDAMKENAKQGRRDTRESRRERKRMKQGLADAEMLSEMTEPNEASIDSSPGIREYMARMGMPNPRQAIRDQYDNAKFAGHVKVLTRCCPWGIAGRRWWAKSPARWIKACQMIAVGLRRSQGYNHRLSLWIWPRRKRRRPGGRP